MVSDARLRLIFHDCYLWQKVGRGVSFHSILCLIYLCYIYAIFLNPKIRGERRCPVIILFDIILSEKVVQRTRIEIIKNEPFYSILKKKLIFF